MRIDARRGTLTLAEVQVMSGSRNIATQGQAASRVCPMALASGVSTDDRRRQRHR